MQSWIYHDVVDLLSEDDPSMARNEIHLRSKNIGQVYQDQDQRVFLYDGFSQIPVSFEFCSQTSSCDEDRQPQHGTVLQTLLYSYNILHNKAGEPRVVLVVEDWELQDQHPPWTHETALNINRMETIQKVLRQCCPQELAKGNETCEITSSSSMSPSLSSLLSRMSPTEDFDTTSRQTVSSAQTRGTSMRREPQTCLKDLVISDSQVLALDQLPEWKTASTSGVEVSETAGPANQNRVDNSDSLFSDPEQQLNLPSCKSRAGHCDQHQEPGMEMVGVVKSVEAGLTPSSDEDIFILNPHGKGQAKRHMSNLLTELGADRRVRPSSGGEFCGEGPDNSSEHLVSSSTSDPSLDSGEVGEVGCTKLSSYCSFKGKETRRKSGNLAPSNPVVDSENSSSDKQQCGNNGSSLPDDVQGGPFMDDGNGYQDDNMDDTDGHQDDNRDGRDGVFDGDKDDSGDNSITFSGGCQVNATPFDVRREQSRENCVLSETSADLSTVSVAAAQDNDHVNVVKGKQDLFTVGNNSLVSPTGGKMARLSSEVEKRPEADIQRSSVSDNDLRVDRFWEADSVSSKACSRVCEDDDDIKIGGELNFGEDLKGETAGLDFQQKRKWAETDRDISGHQSEHGQLEMLKSCSSGSSERYTSLRDDGSGYCKRSKLSHPKSEYPSLSRSAVGSSRNQQESFSGTGNVHNARNPNKRVRVKRERTGCARRIRVRRERTGCARRTRPSHTETKTCAEQAGPSRGEILASCRHFVKIKEVGKDEAGISIIATGSDVLPSLRDRESIISVRRGVRLCQRSSIHSTVEAFFTETQGLDRETSLKQQEEQRELLSHDVCHRSRLHQSNSPSSSIDIDKLAHPKSSRSVSDKPGHHQTSRSVTDNNIHPESSVDVNENHIHIHSSPEAPGFCDSPCQSRPQITPLLTCTAVRFEPTHEYETGGSSVVHNRPSGLSFGGGCPVDSHHRPVLSRYSTVAESQGFEPCQLEESHLSLVGLPPGESQGFQYPHPRQMFVEESHSQTGQSQGFELQGPHEREESSEDNVSSKTECFSDNLTTGQCVLPAGNIRGISRLIHFVHYGGKIRPPLHHA